MNIISPIRTYDILSGVKESYQNHCNIGAKAKFITPSGNNSNRNNSIFKHNNKV